MQRRAIALATASAGCGLVAYHARSKTELQGKPPQRTLSAVYPTLPAVRKVITSVAQNIHVDTWWADANSSGLAAHHPWSITKRTLHGGRQEGVDIIEVNTGTIEFSVLPTRGMSIGTVDVIPPADSDGEEQQPLSWKSPVKEWVHPSHIDLQDHKGLGWLAGFNEWCVRCGVSFAGHPAEEASGHLLTLHGRIGNLPASEVDVSVDADFPHRIRIRGRVDEAMFKFCDFELFTEISTLPGSDEIQISDVLVNKSGYEKEYQMLYHTNFGPPLLEGGSKFDAPVNTVMPFNAQAAAEMAEWQTYLPPTKDYGETVYNLTPHTAGVQGGEWPFASESTLMMLSNAAGDRGVSLRYSADTLPAFALWKNTDTEQDGYVTGLEPATSFPYPRTVERSEGRVPKLGPGEEVRFDLLWKVLRSKPAVDETRAEIAEIADNRRPVLVPRPAGR